VRPPFRDGKIHVQADKCGTCIFRPGNLMHLKPGRVAEMVQTSLADDSAITCHQTLDGDNALCSGFFTAYGDQVFPLRLARAMDALTFVQPDH
jgi:hypothetical protein